ncbi:unnamed protein product [Spirodela intermedia]|uniref:Uncharacterized protein n=1 Tax=Spirodela intermedia TaxID=51605 RepID=A0A7I8JT40_SPIIN|nr:unnamed protein product [Spirodela intermedia]CAA6672773.1 unnamed protein product [Spirodela intermedia]
MATESAREARRRKILERGSDRLAFITGQARSLPPSAIDSPATPRLLIGTRDRRPSVETFLKNEESNEAAYSVLPSSGEIEPATTDDASHHPVVTTGPHPAKRQARIFTAQRISSSISASENIRILCAVSIAALVVHSCRGHLVISDSIHSIISHKPIYMVLLTDLALVLGLLYTGRWKGKDEADAETTRAQEGGDWMDQMGKALEVLLIMQKMASAAFADCCLCAVIIICGISLFTNA